jgi:alpha-tubulin suppressor-like RCC1 family protein
MLWAMGRNSSGQLGDGTTTERYTPTTVTNLSSGVSAVSLGLSYQTCALTTGGGVKCWGYNANGQIGDGTRQNRVNAVEVSGLSSGVVAVALGSSHSCALLETSGVKCWGDNGAGQLGDGTHTERYNPVDVSGLTSGASSISAGVFHTCALLNSGGVKCWGWNGYGQIGTNAPQTQEGPVNVEGLGSQVSSVVSGGYHSCALLNSGGVKCWGYNNYGQLGDGTNTNRNNPVYVSGLTSGVSSIFAGGFHTCAVLINGQLKCWGGNSYRQLGDGTNTDRNYPVSVVSLR